MLGSRFMEYGRNGTGLDCAGLVSAAYAEAGITLADPEYTLPVSSHEVYEKLLPYGRRIALNEALPADVVVGIDGSRVLHLALLSERKTVIMSDSVKRRVREDALYSGAYTGGFRLLAAFRIEGMEG